MRLTREPALSPVARRAYRFCTCPALLLTLLLAPTPLRAEQTGTAGPDTRSPISQQTRPAGAEFERAYAEGVEALRRDDAAAARAAFERAATLAPDSSRAHFQLAQALAMQRQFEAALEHLGACLAIDPADAQAHYLSAVALTELGRLEPAVEQVRAALGLDPRQPRYLHQRGVILRLQGRGDEALEAFEAAERLDPASPVFPFEEGVTLFGMRQHARALVAFRRAHSLKPGWPELENYIGSCHRVRGELDEARRAFQAALDTDARNSNALFGLGAVEMARGDLPAAERYLLRAAELDPDNPFLRYRLGRLRVLQDRTSEAAAEFERAIALRPVYPRAHYNLALAYQRLGRHADAERALATFRAQDRSERAARRPAPEFKFAIPEDEE
jgi:tetratricopeptide (TPR) repeat protein